MENTNKYLNGVSTYLESINKQHIITDTEFESSFIRNSYKLTASQITEMKFKSFINGFNWNEIPTFYNDLTKEYFIEVITYLYKKSYEFSIIENHYWDYCTCNVFKIVYEKKKKEYLNFYNNDAKEIDFIKYEIKKNEKYFKIRELEKLTFIEIIEKLKTEDYESVKFFLFWFTDEEMFEKIQFAQRSKLDFLNEKLKELENKEIKTLDIDFDDEKNINSLTHRIVLLYELKVLDQLQNIQPFNIPNQLAKCLAEIMGAKISTIQPMINLIYGDTSNKSKSPLSRKNIDIIQQQLIKKGVNPKDFKTQK